MVERIRDLCRKKGTNFSRLEQDLGFANGSLAKSDGKIQSQRLKAIADYFNVSMEYLLTGKEETWEEASERISADIDFWEYLFRQRGYDVDVENYTENPDDPGDSTYDLILTDIVSGERSVFSNKDYDLMRNLIEKIIDDIIENFVTYKKK